MERIAPPISKVVVVAFLAAAMIMTAVPAAAMESASYRLEPTVLSSGGGRSVSAGYQLTGTLGQPSPVGLSSSASFRILSGFWHQILDLIEGGDVNGDGFVTLTDAVLALQILTNFAVQEIHSAADVDGDMAVGMAEAAFILQKVGSMR
jgi:hypothetical protein